MTAFPAAGVVYPGLRGRRHARIAAVGYGFKPVPVGSAVVTNEIVDGLRDSRRAGGADSWGGYFMSM